jgi:hypothetical protein
MTLHRSADSEFRNDRDTVALVSQSKRILLRSAGFGAGLGITLNAICAIIFWWSERPKQWTDQAVTARNTDLSFQIVGEEVHFEFAYALTNNLDRDYSLPGPGGAELMRRLPVGALMKVDDVSWSNGIFIPSRQTVNVVFHVNYKFADFNTSLAEINASPPVNGDGFTRALLTFVNNRLKDASGFVIFDYASKYRIDLPSTWEKFAKDTHADTNPK